MKQCIHCGAELPDEASFCPQCEKSQTEPIMQTPPRVWRKRAGILAAIGLIAALAVLAAYLLIPPKTLDPGGPELTYRGYHVLVSMSGNSHDPKPADAEMSNVVPEHTTFAYPAQLCIYDKDDQNAGEAFMEQVERVELTVTPREGGKQMEYSEPEYIDVFPAAVLTSNVVYDADSGVNDLVWTIEMQNGDTLILRQTITAIPQPTVSYYADSAPMETLEELEALLSQIEAEVDEETVVKIFLPPVVYDGGITLKNRACKLYGSSDGETSTTFTGSVIIENGTPSHTELHDLTISGDGTGTGLFATYPVALYDVTVENWETGALASNGAWICPYSSSFENNRVGLQCNSHESTLIDDAMSGNRFAGNEIGILLTAVPDAISVLVLDDCVFSGNDADIQNDTQMEVDTSGASFS